MLLALWDISSFTQYFIVRTPEQLIEYFMRGDLAVEVLHQQAGLGRDDLI
jgi:hypothetical protein